MKGQGGIPAGQGQPGPAALLQRGLTAFRAGHGGDAVRDLTAAARASNDPKIRLPALKHLGISYNRLNVPQSALDALRQAEGLDRNDPQIPVELASCLRRLDRIPESVEACKRARRLNPEERGVTALLMDNLVRLRRDDEALALMQEVDRLGIVSPEIDHAFVSVAIRLRTYDEGIARLRRHAQNEGLNRDLRARAFHGLGDLFDAAARYDEAWDAYAKGNEIRGGVFEPQRWLDSIDVLVRVWSTDVISRLQEGASSDPTPVLVVGMPRSGTTLTDMTLGRHPQVHMGGELATLGTAFAQISRTIGFSADARPDLVTPQHIALAAAYYSGEMARLGQGAARVTNKMPMNVAILGLFAAMFPQGTIIHCRRDPRDVCLSCYFRNFLHPNPYTNRPDWLAAYHRGYATLIRHWGKVLSRLERSPRLHETRYEEAVSDPASNARALIAAVGLDWDEACAQAASPDRSVATLRADQVGKTLYTSSKGRHVNYTRHLGPWADLTDPSFWDAAGPG